ncbi:hypothetical protein C6499_22510 [Candidatus Poribacteria bacterium]|nr:MAG: hypothetical protein C6499_22510 [Candidatus Poribacteria bacterium]
MALSVVVTGGENIDQGGQVTLNATVTDANGNTPPGTLQYTWRASRGTFIGATDEASAVYHADFTDAADVDVTITCDVTRPAESNPTVSAGSLTAMTALGITGQILNMFINPTADTRENARSNIHPGGTLASGSDSGLSSNLQITQIEWNDRTNRFILTRSGSGNIGTFFQGVTTRAVFVIFSDGTVLELNSSDIAVTTAARAQWNVSNATLQQKFVDLDGSGSDSSLLVGVADAGSIGWSEDTGSDTETFTAAAVVTRAIAMVADQNIVVNTDYRLTVAITGNPTTVEVTGDMEYFNYDWRAGDNEVKIVGHPEKLLNNKNWHIEATYSSGDPLERDITFNVVPAAPVFGTVPDIHLYRDVDINLEIPITNPPSEVIAKTLLLGLGIEKIETGAKIDGVIPADANFTVTAGNIEMEAPHLGETVMSSVPYTIEAGTPPALGQIEQTPKGNFAVVSFPDVQHAIEYEWGIDEGSGVDFINYNRFGPNRPVIDLEHIKVTPRHLNATVTFPHVPGATRYEYLIGGNWHEFVAAPVNNLIQTIIPDLEEGETYQVYFRVSSPWIGVPVPVQVTGGRLAYALHGDSSANDDHVLFVFSTGTQDGIASPIKRILIPDDVNTPSDLAIDFENNHFYISDTQDSSIHVFDLNTNHDTQATRLRKFFKPSTLSGVFALSIYGNTLYGKYFDNNYFESFSANTANGQVATRINRYITNIPGGNNSRTFASYATDELVYFMNTSGGNAVVAFPREPANYADVDFTINQRIATDIHFDSSRGVNGLSVIGNTAYISDLSSNTQRINIVDLTKAHTDAGQVIKQFIAPPGCDRIVGLDIAV